MAVVVCVCVCVCECACSGAHHRLAAVRVATTRRHVGVGVCMWCAYASRRSYSTAVLDSEDSDRGTGYFFG